MERLQTNRIEDRETVQQKSGARELELQQTQVENALVPKANVPCSCPGCFPFDF